MCMDPPFPYDIPSTRPGKSAAILVWTGTDPKARLTHQFRQNTLDGTASQYGESVTPVRSDDPIVSINRILHPDRNSLLTDSKMTETSDHLLLVQRIGSLFHPSHSHLTISTDPFMSDEEPTICLYMCTRSSLVTSTSVLGPSHRYEWKLSSGRLTLN